MLKRLLLCLALLSPTGAGAMDGEALYRWCSDAHHAPDVTPLGLVCVSYLMGIRDAIGFLAASGHENANGAPPWAAASRQRPVRSSFARSSSGT